MFSHFMKAVTAAATAERLSADDLWVSSAFIQVESNNTGLIYGGDSTVSASDYGFELPIPVAGALAPGFNLVRPDAGNINLKDVWIDASVSSDGVAVSYIPGKFNGPSL